MPEITPIDPASECVLKIIQSDRHVRCFRFEPHLIPADLNLEPASIVGRGDAFHLGAAQNNICDRGQQIVHLHQDSLPLLAPLKILDDRGLFRRTALDMQASLDPARLRHAEYLHGFRPVAFLFIL